MVILIHMHIKACGLLKTIGYGDFSNFSINSENNFKDTQKQLSWDVFTNQCLKRIFKLPVKHT